MSVADEAKNKLAKQENKRDLTSIKSFEKENSSTIAEYFNLYKGQIAQSAAKHLTAERLIQISTTLIARDPKLKECSIPSLIGAVLQCSMYGFEPTPVLGQCYLIPFNNKGKQEVQFMMGYRGMLDLAYRSNKIKTVYAEAVYENDLFEYELGLDTKLKHIPARGDRGALIYVYAVAKFTNEGYSFQVMTKNDVDKIKNKSKAGNSNFSPWNSGYYDEMAKKTVLRRLFKYLPTSIEYKDINSAIASDGQVLKVENFKDGELQLSELDNYEIMEETEQKEIAESTNQTKSSLFEE